MPIKLYQRKPSVLRGVKWTGNNFEELEELASMSNPVYGRTVKRIDAGLVHVLTTEGKMNMTVGGYLMLGTDGELFPIKESTFPTIYEEVEH